MAALRNQSVDRCPDVAVAPAILTGHTYRVDEYKARPWDPAAISARWAVIYVTQHRAAAPPHWPRFRLYELRFGPEHSLRFMKREVSPPGAQCNGASGRRRIASVGRALRPVCRGGRLRCAPSRRRRASTDGPRVGAPAAFAPGALRRVAVGIDLSSWASIPLSPKNGESPPFRRACTGWTP